MGLLRRLVVSLSALLVVAGTALFAIPGRASAASTYEYTDSATSCATTASNATDLAIAETTTVSGGTQTYFWCYVPNSTHEFARGSSSSIAIADPDRPEQGTLTVANGQPSTVTIGNTTVFTQAFPDASREDFTGEESCESAGGVMGWVTCPLVSLMSSAIEWLDERIQGLLEVEEERYTHPQLHAAWVIFRNLAYIVLIPIMLVMVIGTALGFEVFTAYTVKKALPRMVLAILFITMSWHISIFFINFFNVIGGGILGLMTAPFDMPDNMSLNTLFSASGNDTIGETAGSGVTIATQWAATLGPLVALAALVTSPGGLMILLLYLVPVVLFILGAFIVLAAREIFILASILLAPLAILAWIFPGNDKPWKLWWNLFSKLLMMFPLIMIVIGAGRIFAYLIDIPGSEESLVNPLLKLTAYVIPYMFIPFAFKFAGGTFASLAGFVNDREKGMFDRLKKKRGENMAEYRQRAGRNAIFDKEKAAKMGGFKGSWMRSVNTAGGWLAEPLANTQIALGTEKGRSIMSQVRQGAFEDSQKLMEVLSRNGFNAEELSALSLGRVSKRKGADGKVYKHHIRAWDGTSQDLQRIADELEAGTDEQERIGGRHLRANSSFLTEVNRNEEYGRASVQLAAGLAYSAQGFATPEEIARLASEMDGYKYKAQYTYKTEDGKRVLDEVTHVLDSNNLPAQPFGLGGIVKTNAELLAARAGGLGKPGYGVRVGADGSYVATDTREVGTDAQGNIILSGGKIEQVVRTGVQDLSAAKGGQLTNQLGDAISVILTAKPGTKYIEASGAERDIASIRTGVEETLVQVMGSYAAPDVKRRVYGMLVDAKRQTLIGTTRTVKVKDANGNETVTTVTVNEQNVADYAESDVRALLSRSSGAIDPTKLDLGNRDEDEKK